MSDHRLRKSFPFTQPSAQDIRIFCEAARDANMDKLTLCLDTFGDAIINERDEIKACALTWAAFAGQREVVELLLKRGANIEAPGTEERSALGWAATCERKEVVLFLLEKGASPDARDTYGDTPLMLAQKHYDPSTAKVMEEWIENNGKKQQQAAENDKEACARAEAAERLEKLYKIKAKTPQLRKKP